MTAKLSQGLGEQVTCAICLEHFTDPRILPCLHTYCRQCLQDLLAKGGKRLGSVICPECREEVPIISGDVTKLKFNFWINNILSLLALHSNEQEEDGGKTRLTCENCDIKETATRRCVDCCVFLCDFCSTAHQRYVATKDHKLMSLDELKDTGIPVFEKQLFCTKHRGEVKKLFCNTCQELICRDCTIIDHLGHQFNFIEDIADQHKETFKEEIRKASSVKNKVETVLRSVQETKRNMEKESKATEKDVDDFIDKQIAALEEKRVSLKEETRRIATKKMKELATQEDGLVMHLTGLKSAIEFTEKVLKNGGSSDILSISKEITSRFSQVCQKQFNETPCQQHSMGLTFVEQTLRDWIEQHVNVIDANLPDPKQCSITSSINGLVVPNQGPIEATPGEVLNFVVCVRNAFGEKLGFLKDRIEVKVGGVPLKTAPQSFPYIRGSGQISGRQISGRQSQTSKIVACSKQTNNTSKVIGIQRHGDNTYTFDFLLDRGITGAEINVTIDGIQIQGCPFQITLKRRNRRSYYTQLGNCQMIEVKSTAPAPAPEEFVDQCDYEYDPFN